MATDYAVPTNTPTRLLTERRTFPRIAERPLTWRHAALGAVLLVVAALNLWGLDREGYANTYYAAAVKSMLTSWHNFLYLSFDSGGFVSVDKAPLGLWVQAASAAFYYLIMLGPPVAALAGIGLRAVAGLPGGARERPTGGTVARLALAADAHRDGGGAALPCRPIRGPVRVAAPSRRGRLPARGCGPGGGAAAPGHAPCSRGLAAGGVAHDRGVPPTAT